MYAVNLVSAFYALFLALTILTSRQGRSTWSRFAMQIMAASSLTYLAAFAVLA